ncbi:MAG: 4Fe-4S dicluster domain-containing protein [Deltaproteobacteria bacterium]|nr:4Fe-4S dicluster domain-containing protein [Deltaproteobacteria bacterium]MBW2137032.1 4Fe-4S dicluster domain-containing protein [Deltaproteobacteria bacterium]
MNNKVIFVEPGNCNGCKECETACSVRQQGFHDPELSCIRILKLDDDDSFYLPATCQQCEDPPCLAACPEQAIYRDEELGRVMIDKGRCIGCRMCFSACPTGAMGFDESRGLAFKCDLCGGAPECVRVCEPRALSYVDPYRLQYPRILSSAERFWRPAGTNAA